MAKESNLAVGFVIVLPILLWAWYGVLWRSATNKVFRYEGELAIEWKRRVGEGVAEDVYCSGMPILSVPIAAVLCAFVLMPVIHVVSR